MGLADPAQVVPAGLHLELVAEERHRARGLLEFRSAQSGAVLRVAHDTLELLRGSARADARAGFQVVTKRRHEVSQDVLPAIAARVLAPQAVFRAAGQEVDHLHALDVRLLAPLVPDHGPPDLVQLLHVAGVALVERTAELVLRQPAPVLVVLPLF